MLSRSNLLSQRRSGNALTVAALIIVLALLGTYITLVFAKVIPLPAFLRGKDAASQRANMAPPKEGEEDVVVTPRPILAYQPIERGSLVTNSAQEFVTIRIRKSEFTAETLPLRFGELMGRVTRHDIPTGYPISERDLLPKGSRPGIAGATPPGKRALVIEADKVQGVYGLNNNDHFDLVAVIPTDKLAMPAMGTVPHGATRIVGANIDTSIMAASKMPAIRVVVSDGVMLKRVGKRPGTPAAQAASRASEEFTIAASPQEIAALTEAMGTKGVELMMVARSGQPGETPANAGVIALPANDSPMRIEQVGIETIVGEKRQTLIFDTAKPAPKSPK